jgi:hypothetical protein
MCADVDWIQVATDSVEWSACVNTTVIVNCFSRNFCTADSWYLIEIRSHATRYVAPFLQHATRVRRVIVASPTVNFCTLSHTRHDFEKEIMEHKMCFNFLCNFCLKYAPIIYLCIYCICMYSLYVHVSSSCQLALFGYPDWGFSVLFPQL